MVDVGNVGTVFCKTAKMKEDVRLCADALHATLPLQYRYLLLYKLFLFRRYSDPSGG